MWIYFYLPETKNASLEEMDRIFGSHTGVEDAAMLAAAQRDVGLIDFIHRHEVRKGSEVETKESGMR